MRREEWGHIDLFPIREMIQENAIEWLKLDKKGYPISKWLTGEEDPRENFVRKSLEISLRLANILNPMVVVIVSGFISRKIIESYSLPSMCERRQVSIQRSSTPKIKIDSSEFWENGYRTISIN